MTKTPAEVQTAIVRAKADVRADDGVVVAKSPLGYPLTRGALRIAFSAVENAEHWKNPIDARLGVELLGSIGGKSTVTEAIRFFAGCDPSWQFDDITLTHRVMAGGYYRAVGA